MFSEKAKAYCEKLGDKARVRKASAPKALSSPFSLPLLSPPLLVGKSNTLITNTSSECVQANPTLVVSKPNHSNSGLELSALPLSPFNSETNPNRVPASPVCDLSGSRRI